MYTTSDKTERSSSYRYLRFMDHRGIQWRELDADDVLGVPRSKGNLSWGVATAEN